MEQGILDDMEPPELAHAHGNALHQDALRGGAGPVLGFQIAARASKSCCSSGLSHLLALMPCLSALRDTFALPSGLVGRFCLPWCASRFGGNVPGSGVSFSGLQGA